MQNFPKGLRTRSWHHLTLLQLKTRKLIFETLCAAPLRCLASNLLAHVVFSSNRACRDAQALTLSVHLAEFADLPRLRKLRHWRQFPKLRDDRWASVTRRPGSERKRMLARSSELQAAFQLVSGLVLGKRFLQLRDGLSISSQFLLHATVFSQNSGGHI